MVTKVHLRKYPRKKYHKGVFNHPKTFPFLPAKQQQRKATVAGTGGNLLKKTGFRRPPRKKNLENRSKILLKKPLTENSNSSVCGGGWGMTRCINVCNAFAFPCLWAVIPYTPTSSEHVETQSTDMSPPPRCCIDFAIQDWVFKSIFTVSCGHFFG